MAWCTLSSLLWAVLPISKGVVIYGLALTSLGRNFTFVGADKAEQPGVEAYDSAGADSAVHRRVDCMLFVSPSLELI